MEWKFIENPKVVPNRYQVSEDGQIRDIFKGRVIKQRQSLGYSVVCLASGGTPRKYSHSVHRIVASAFLTRDEGQDQVDHIDGDKTNNHVSNLRWCTRLENARNPITAARVREATKDRIKKLSRALMCIETGEVFESANEASKKFSICSRAISNSCEKYMEYEKTGIPLKQLKGHYHFRYIDTIPHHVPKLPSASAELHAPTISPKAKSIRCIETGIIYSSINEACNLLGLSHKAIVRSCKEISSAKYLVSERGHRSILHFEWYKQDDAVS